MDKLAYFGKRDCCNKHSLPYSAAKKAAIGNVSLGEDAMKINKNSVWNHFRTEHTK